MLNIKGDQDFINDTFNYIVESEIEIILSVCIIIAKNNFKILSNLINLVNKICSDCFIKITFQNELETIPKQKFLKKKC